MNALRSQIEPGWWVWITVWFCH